MAETREQFDESKRRPLLRALKWCKKEKTPCKIDEGLFLGSIATSDKSNKDALKHLNITHILKVTTSAPVNHEDIVYKTIDVADKHDANIKQYFNECFDFIDEAKRRGGSVLVHCFAGRSRSVAIIVAYLMKTRGMSLSEAMQHVKDRRPQATPNAGFMSQLEDFEKSLQVTN